MASDGWTIVPNLWGLFVGRPSAKKSPAMSAGLKPLERLEDRAADHYGASLEGFGIEQQLHTHQVKATASKIQGLLRKGDAKSKSDAAALIEEQSEMEPKEPDCTRYVANDTTVEKLADLLQTNPSLLVCRDELSGFFANLERNGQESARSFYLESWSGDKPFKVDRIGRGSTRIPRSCVSVLGGIQPGPVSSLMREAQRHSRGNDGLMQRFQLAVWPDLSSRFELVDVEPNAENWRDLMQIFECFADFSPADVGAQFPETGVPYLRFSTEAQRLFSRWLEDHENRIRNEDLPECMEAHLGKYPSLVPSIALILHLAEGHTGPVDVLSTQKAIAWAVYLEAHANRIYAPIVGADFVAARALAKKIKAKKLPEKFSLREVYRHGWANLSSEETRLAAEVLEDFNWIERRQEATEGRTATLYQVNPLVWEAAE
jgi:hypothetical protein